MARGRPKKDVALLMTKDIRIPVTDAQKEIVTSAMKIKGLDTAGWARQVLIDAAQAIIDAHAKATHPEG